MDYTYNIRDWLTGINNPNSLGSDYFAMTLGYTTGDDPEYNGNISEMYWKTGNFALSEYQFDYDGANRLTDAVYSGTGQHTTSYTYYKNGNIKTLSREGRFGDGPQYGMIDNLTYNYSGNQLNYVNDYPGDQYQNNGFSDNGSTGTEYTYDPNGNMITDLNKNLTVNRYNYLNLPEQIQIEMNGLNHINYLSPIAIGGPGSKLAQQTVEDGVPQNTTAPIAIGGGSFVYEDGELQYLLTSEGRVVFNPDGTHDYQYFLKDHLGNTRVTFNENGNINQEDSYYPFGMLERSGNPAIAGTMAGLSHQSGEDLPNKYLYNAEKPEISDFIVFRASSKNHKKQSFLIFRDGKELQDDYGLDWYDYGARFYDPVIGRWHVIDFLTENYIYMTPYAHSLNNPIRFVDPDGNQPWDVINAAKLYYNTWYEYGGKKPFFIGGGEIQKDNATDVSLLIFYILDLEEYTGDFSSLQHGVYGLFNLTIPSGYSIGIDCSGLSRLAFNADPDKNMPDLPVGAHPQMVAFQTAEKAGTGLLHSDLSQLKKGDLVFKTSKVMDKETKKLYDRAYHVMIATGAKQVNKNGILEYEMIEAPESGKRVGTTWVEGKANYRIGLHIAIMIW